VVPDLEGRARKYLGRLESGDAEANSWLMRNAGLGAEHRLRGLAALARTTFGNATHLWMWDEPSMAAALRQAGFIAIRRCEFNDCTDSAFEAVEDALRFREPSGLKECAMEARRPAFEK
jgi:hypothetical protein